MKRLRVLEAKKRVPKTLTPTTGLSPMNEMEKRLYILDAGQKVKRDFDAVNELTSIEVHPRNATEAVLHFSQGSVYAHRQARKVFFNTGEDRARFIKVAQKINKKLRLGDMMVGIHNKASPLRPSQRKAPARARAAERPKMEGCNGR